MIVEGVDNPANVGGIVRNAAGLGWDGLLLDHTSADPLARRALRVAMGTAFTLPHARTRNLAEAIGGDHGLTLYALTPDPGAADIRSVRPAGTEGGRDRIGTGGVVGRGAVAVHAGSDRDGERCRFAQCRGGRRRGVLRTRLIGLAPAAAGTPAGRLIPT